MSICVFARLHSSEQLWPESILAKEKGDEGSLKGNRLYIKAEKISFTGGAERLIVDAAVELANKGHSVKVFTAHHDRRRCFEETLDGERASL